MNLTRPISLAICVGTFAYAGGPAQEKKPELAVVKYDGLKREVLKHRGKVVIVDFWAGY